MPYVGAEIFSILPYGRGDYRENVIHADGTILGGIGDRAANLTIAAHRVSLAPSG